MYKKTSISDRLKKIRKGFNCSQQEFCEKINTSLRGYQDNERGKTAPGSKILEEIRKIGVDINWLLSGEGEMILKRKTQSNQVNERPKVEYAGLFSNEFAQVSVYDVEASAGHGSHIDQEIQTGQISFRKDWLKEKNLVLPNLAIIKARGDSMQPTITDGDILLVNLSINKIIDDAIYIIRNDGHLAVKRIRQNFDGSIKIISDNSKYGSETITQDKKHNLLISGKAVWIGKEI